ncbi:transcriptional adapter 2-alpha-like [Rhinatrema bivittatum]|uniref:transcriptional adapter 2-alpha-like n=1 Tax=Rhinatrema bivittatum TaxID=194408 RepID=UPI001126107B|nr:transcriptional adapter 2-alpha-like [Rhinatrema bivittatum]
MAYINHQREIKSQGVAQEAQQLILWAEEHLERIAASHVTGVKIVQADFLSQTALDPGEWDLSEIIKDHGLINLRKFQILERRYPKEVQDLYEVMRHFARIVGPVQHDKFIESHALEFELRREIKRLQEYRAAGIKTFCSARMYDHLKRSREEEQLKRTMLTEVLQYIQDSSACLQWLNRQATIDSGLNPAIPITSNSGRRNAPPLNLTGLPGTEKLNEKEKELCQVVRLVPGAYLEYKAALVNECIKEGSLRLAQARALIKIDVNKTRKIYDFLIREGCINKA